MIRGFAVLLITLLGIAAALAQAQAQAPSPSPSPIATAVSQAGIPAQPVAAALTELAKQTGLQIIYGSEAVRGLKSKGAPAGLSAAEALARVLEGTGLSYEFLNERTVTILDAALVRKKAAASAHADDHAVQLAQALEKSGFDEETRQPRGDQKVEEIMVTGSRLKSDHAPKSTTLTVFDRQKIGELGVTSVAAVLDYLPQQPFASRENAATDGRRVVRLRGLGNGTTLVLINGRRTVTSAVAGVANEFDLNTIPLSAVERIEVVSESTSAVYGADAAGGVMNIILKSDIADPTLDLYYGSADGGAEERRASLSLGASTDRVHGILMVDAYDRDFLSGSKRGLSADQDYRRFGSTDRRSLFANPGNVTSASTANLPGLSSRTAAIPVGSTGTLTPADFVATAGRQNLESTRGFSSLIPSSKRFSGASSLSFDFTDTLSAFAEILYSDSKTALPLSPVTTTAAVPAANPFNPFRSTGTAVSVSYRFAGLEPGLFKTESDSLRGVVGLRGQVSSWDWEVGAMRIDDNSSQWSTNVLDPARVTAALAATDPAQALNVFRDGPGGSPELLASLIAAPVVRNASSEATQGNGFIRGNLFALPAGDVNAVFGGEIRSEKLHFEAATATTDGDRKSSAIFAEFLLPLIDNPSSVLFKKLALNVAGRFDRYSDFGDTFNPHYALEWSPIRSLAVTASYGTSFRPASLYQLRQLRSSSAGTIPDPRRNGANSPVTLFRGGNAGLEPEESDSFSVGFVITPESPNDLRFRMNYWKVQQEERVQNLAAAIILANEAMFADRVVRAAPGANDILAGQPGPLISIDQTNVNFGALQTDGVDADLSLHIDTGIGRFAPSFAVTWIGSFDAADVPGAALINRVGVADIQGSIPQWRATASLAWNVSRGGASATARYTDAYADASVFGVRNGRMIPAQTPVDLQAWANVGLGIQLTVGVRNLFDEEPGFAEIGGLYGYDTSQGDLLNRFMYAAVSKKF